MSALLITVSPVSEHNPGAKSSLLKYELTAEQVKRVFILLLSTAGVIGPVPGTTGRQRWMRWGP